MWDGQFWEKAQDSLQCSTTADVSSPWDLRLFMASLPGLMFKTLRVWMRLCVCVHEWRIFVQMKKAVSVEKSKRTE